MKEKQRIRKEIGIVLIMIVLISLFFAKLLWNVAAYTTENAKESRTFGTGWAVVSMHGPSGNSWLSLKFNYKGKQMTQDDFNAKSRNITIETSNVSNPNPYELKLVTSPNSSSYSTQTALNNKNNYTSIYFEVEYKIPAHEVARGNTPESYDSPYDLKTEGRYASVTTHSSSAHTVKLKIRVSIYSIGICSYYGEGKYTYNRYYGSELSLYLEKKRYKIVYDGNGGNVIYPSNYPSDGLFTDGDPYPEVSAVRTGYELAGFQNPDNYYQNSRWTVCGNNTMTAQWTANRYMVRYDGNGGDSGEVLDEDATYDQNYTFAQNGYTKKGYSFVGWNTDKNAMTAQYTQGQTITWKGLNNMTLYAIWQKSFYEVTFNGNGASGAKKTVELKYETADTLPLNTFERAGYTFIGWNEDPDAVKPKYTDGQNVNILCDAGKTYELYAIWKKSDGSFDTHNIIRDDGMFNGAIELEGQNGTGFSRNHTDSGYARIDKDGQQGYFTDRYR